MKIGSSSSKKSGAEGRAKEPDRSRINVAKRAEGRPRILGRRTARVAPAHTVFVVPAVDGSIGRENKKKRSSAAPTVLEEGMASNGDDTNQEPVEMVDAELSPEHDGECLST